ncbi:MULTISPECIES: PilT/PilU family type 4a pilus ATPase [unclassified Polaromonas]|uniref:PilT/PilU family type 4a pilus ATPase n=1 Tax=unclassified Polaromonas TaxID=2638319 RepID=UPI0025DD9376|nr:MULTISPECIES: PilT/PilU family type 4a pilus ATPase [unclassified Polaromonas]HQS01154.1 PilT/PilU family type 4a pilus ATPase [Polaromonas sp.]HQS41934.1 PilT/PilU family type 4a pilus ATPase [Polaromonas sp.]HQS87478.1 PilT/PilU family type 4a pilus ATPase [Polaromonas sp.]HQT07600.1 PilT/PilU family type 4a pilus ATPase [Polaromonas sp.]
MDAISSNDLNDMGRYLQFMVKSDASDLFVTVGAPPSVKVHGVIRPMNLPALTSGDAKSLAYSVMRESQMREFESSLECDLATTIDGLGRFRFNIFMQRGEVAMVVRYITSTVASIDELKLPPALKGLAILKRGLVLVVGAAGSGKSTTLAAMLDYRNGTVPGHILTIEDPIEFVHHHKQSLVDQREVGLDTHSFEEALRHAMREAPDVIMIGEIRDRLTMQHAMAYAETGHLCVSTLHANNANQAIERVLNLFPEESRRQALMDLSLNLKGVVAQRLIKGTSGKLVPAVEVMLQSPYISDLILKGQADQIKPAMAKSNELGMQTFDQSLYNLYTAGDITLEQAIENADSKTDLSLRVRLTSGRAPDASGMEIKS